MKQLGIWALLLAWLGYAQCPMCGWWGGGGRVVGRALGLLWVGSRVCGDVAVSRTASVALYLALQATV